MINLFADFLAMYLGCVAEQWSEPLSDLGFLCSIGHWILPHPLVYQHEPLLERQPIFLKEAAFRRLYLSAGGQWTPTPILKKLPSIAAVDYHTLCTCLILNSLGVTWIVTIVLLSCMSFHTCMFIAVPHTDQVNWRESKFLCWNQANWPPKITSPSPVCSSFCQKCTVTRLFYLHLPLIGHSVIGVFPHTMSGYLLCYIEHSLLQGCNARIKYACSEDAHWTPYLTYMDRTRLHGESFLWSRVLSFSVFLISGNSGPSTVSSFSTSSFGWLRMSLIVDSDNYLPCD